jgi:predicted dehydrogenase
MKNKNPISRRTFLKTAVTLPLAFSVIPGHLIGRNAPSGKLNIAAIGIGGMGSVNLANCESENIVALCDVDLEYAMPIIQKYPRAKVYKDYREMLEKQKDIDAVIIATPDHTHAVIAMACINAGKHIFLQKPLCHTVYETRIITEAARKAGVQTQMGNQGHSWESIRILKEWIEDGAIGNVTEVRAWTDRPAGGYPIATFAVKKRPEDEPPIPKHLDWDMWLGPATYRPYHSEYHPLKWRAWQDFGTGALGDMGCHIIDPAFWALDLGAPSQVQATSTHWEEEVMNETYPRASVVWYDFPARGNKPPVKLTWYDGRLLPPVPEELEAGRRIPASGAFIIGDKGVIMHGSHGAMGVRIIPESSMKTYDTPKATIPRVDTSHEEDWIRACKEGNGGAPACTNFEYGGPLTEMVLLGVTAIKARDQVLKWDTQNLKITNNEEANKLLHKDYRSGWSL